MVQSAGGLHFPQEALRGFPGGGGGRVDDLQGHFPADDAVPGQEHFAHGAFAQGPDDVEFANAAGGDGHGAEISATW